MYDAAIPFNAIKYPSFQVMVESIGHYGVGLKPPSHHEVTVPLLKNEVGVVTNMMKSCEDEWAKYGCSLMLDGWMDKKERTLINFLVNSPKGTFFLQSVDASDYSKTREKMFELIDGFIERLGEANVIQVVTDNTTSNVLAGKLLEANRPHLYWTPSAAHCIDLMLDDIEKMPNYNWALKQAMSLNAHIYVRPGLVDLLSRFTGHRELVRAGVTRFATAFLTLQRINKQKNSLRTMFLSDDWRTSKWAKEAAGKQSSRIVWRISFWNNIVYMLRIFGPLVRVLRLVYSEKKPAMGYIFEAMDMAKEAIMKAFNEKEEKYKEIFKIIDDRWESQLHRPLHAAGYYLNPEFFYSHENIFQCTEVMAGLYKALERLIPGADEQDKIVDQIPLYRNAEGLFGMELAIRHRKTKAPAEWWILYFASTPNLQRFAIKVLSLTCSTSGCGHNWSIFEHMHSQKRNRSAQQCLKDLVFVKYNRLLKRRYDARDSIDPISLGDIDGSGEWLMGSMDGEYGEFGNEDESVFDDHHLTWGAVAGASRVEEEADRVGPKQVEKSEASRKSTSTSLVFDFEEEEEEEVETDYEEIDEFGEEDEASSRKRTSTSLILTNKDSDFEEDDEEEAEDDDYFEFNYNE